METLKPHATPILFAPHLVANAERFEDAIGFLEAIIAAKPSVPKAAPAGSDGPGYAVLLKQRNKQVNLARFFGPVQAKG